MLESLVAFVKRYTDAQPGSSPYETAVDGVYLFRSDRVKAPAHVLFRPALCLALQGGKWARFAERRQHYRAGEALVISVDIPSFGCVADARPDKPYLGMVVAFDVALMREVCADLQLAPRSAGAVDAGWFVTPIAAPIADCALRLVRLLETPAAIPVLRAGIMRELYYWLLTGPNGDEIARVALATEHDAGVAAAVHAVRTRFTESLRIDELAALARMSTSAFHRRFKALTSMTPLQYQKRLRLLEARNVLIAGDANVETAAFRVGYESASQFNREYTRMFGTSPRRDVAALRERFAHGLAEAG